MKEIIKYSTNIWRKENNNQNDIVKCILENIELQEILDRNKLTHKEFGGLKSENHKQPNQSFKTANNLRITAQTI